MPPLDTALALAEMNDLAMLVTEHLKFYVARPLEKFLGVDIWNSESLLCFTSRGLVGAQKFFLPPYHTHPSSAAPRGSLEYQREANARRLFRKLLFPFDNPRAPRNRGQPRRLHFPPGPVLLAHHFNNFRSWADKRDF